MAEVERRRKHREPLTVNRLLAGADRADLVNRAEEIARTGKSPMLLVWYDDGDVMWRNAGMTNADCVFACEVIKAASIGTLESRDA